MRKWLTIIGRFAQVYLFEYTIAVVLGGVFGHWVVGNSFRVFSPNWLATIYGALAGVFVAFALRNPHLLTLVDLKTLSPLGSIWRGRHSARKAKLALLNEFRQIELMLLRLLSSGHLEKASYRDQMDLAFLLCSGHSRRFWATSLDRWSTFLRSNDTYIWQMMTECSEHVGAQVPHDDQIRPPGHARLFILPVSDFLRDIIHAPTEARVLVKHHLDAWRVPLKLLLHKEESFFQAFKEKIGKLEAEGKISAPTIPDFMIVDDRFVYGRSKPDRMDIKTVRGPEVELSYSHDPKVVGIYETIFLDLWENSLDVRSFCSALEVVSQGRPCPSTPLGTAISMTLEALDKHSADEKKALFRTFGEFQVELNDFFNTRERAERYSAIPVSSEGQVVVEGFLAYMKSARGAIFAIDKADVKNKEKRFWETWGLDEHFLRWNLETQASKASPKQRIFVLRELKGLDKAESTAFILDQVKHNISLGFILECDLQSLATSKAIIDSDFILVDIEKIEGDWRIGGSTRGFEVSYNQYNIREISRESLLCQEKMANLLSWYLEVWKKCLVVESVSGLNEFWRELRARCDNRKVVA